MKKIYLDESGQQWLAETNQDGQTIWQKIGAAFTNPDAAFSLPIVYPVELSKPTRQVIIGAAIVLGGSLIVSSYLKSRKNAKR